MLFGTSRWLLLASLLCLAPARSEPWTADQHSARPPLVFVLSDADAQIDDYLDAANAYYTAASGANQAPLRAHSLTDLHNLLVGHFESYGALGEVVLVVHGSTWTGATIDLFPGGPKARVSNMRLASKTQSFPALPAGAVDAQTRFVLDSCAVGRHQAWTDAFAQLWANSGTPLPRVVASTGFVYFGYERDDQLGKRWRRSIAPVRVSVVPGPSAVAVETRERLAPQQCAEVPSPCERRLLPIRVEVDLDAAMSFQSLATRRKMAQKLARTQLRDLNLRPDQLLWRVGAAVHAGTQRWQGLATAIVVSPISARAESDR